MAKQFKEVKTFKRTVVRSKTEREYERLFEDLVEYTDFNSVDDIIGKTKKETQQNLNKFFRDIKKDAVGRGRKFTISNSFVDEFSKAFMRIAKTPRRKTKVVSRDQQVVEGKFFSDYATAKENLLTAVNDQGIEVFKTKVIVNKKESVRYRDKQGRFRSVPVKLESE